MGKKSKKHRHKSESYSSSSDEYHWEPQKPSTAEVSKETSDSTAFDALLGRITSQKEPHRGAKKAEPESSTAKVVKLNHYWTNEGGGLPEDRNTAPPVTKLNANNEQWLARAFKRAEEESSASGVSIRNLLLDRWDAEMVDAMERRFGRRQGSEDKRPRWKKKCYNAPRSPIRRDDGEYEVRRDSDHSRAPIQEDANEDRRRRMRTADPDDYPEDVRTQSEAVDALPTKQVEERYVTDADLNSAAALLMKAELMGNQDKIGKLQARLDKLREAQRRGLKIRLTKTVSSVSDSSSSLNSNKVVQLTNFDRHGREMPLHLGSSSASLPSRSKYAKIASHDDEGRRINFLREDESASTLEDLVRMERMESRNASDMQFAHLAGKCRRDPEDEYDDAFASKKALSQDAARQRQKSNAVSDYKRKEFALKNCAYCLEHVPRYLIMSAGQGAFLSLPEHVSMTRGHCLITPTEHVGAMTRADDSTAVEVRELKCSLCRMAATKLHPPGGSYVFLETAAYPTSFKFHVQIECIPVDRLALQELPSYFKKALHDLGSEWDQNKRVVKLRQPGMGARNAIPENFGYFAVEFGDKGEGFAKVIEDWSTFTSYFGREVVAGVLEEPSSKWRRPKPDSLEELRRKSVDFEQCWVSVGGQTVDVDDDNEEPEGPSLPPSMQST